MKRKQKKQGLFLVFGFLGISLLGFYLATPSVFADVMDIGNWDAGVSAASGAADSFFEKFESRYHLNLESLQNQGENLNVSSQKGQAPQVLLFFSPSDPKSGDTIEARAFPQFFQNATETLYFTWYLKRKGCGLDDSPGDAKLERCDRDSNPGNSGRKITVEDWKIEAMRTLVSGGFDASCSMNGNLDTDAEREKCAENMYDEDAPSRINPTGRKGRDSDDDGYIPSFGGDGRSEQNDYCYVHDFQNGLNYEFSSCKHLFPGKRRINNDGKIEDAVDARTGKFPIDEEHFWGTDPEDPSTAHNGNKDAANIVGLGQNVFKWTYMPGDEVGVAVEGASMYNTKYDNSSMMIMWALPKNKCSLDTKNGDFRSSKTVQIKGYSVTIQTIRDSIDGHVFDINDCLDENLMDPTEGGQAEQLDLSLRASPEEPSAKLIPWSKTDMKADEAAQTGDILTVSASSSNASRGTNSTNYVWRVQASTNGTFNTRFDDKNSWRDITTDLTMAKNIGSTKGSGVSSLSINLNLNKTSFTSDTKIRVPGFSQYFKDDIAYFRILANATENFSGKVSQSGISSIVVKVVANKSIEAFDVGIETGASGLTVKRKSASLCASSSFQQTICPVLDHQIIGVRLDTTEEDAFRNYSWTLNGEPLVCSKKVSDECADDKQGEINFFPISGNVGDLFTLAVTASNAGTNEDEGKSFTVSRRFQIVDPDFDIVSKKEEVAWGKHLGDYVNLDGSKTNDISKTSFEGVPGGVAQFSAVFRPTVLGTFVLDGIRTGDDQNELIWSINGKPFKWNDAGLSLALDGGVGDIYTISLSGAYNQPRELRKALYDIWKISPFSSETVRFSKEAQIRLVRPEGGEAIDAYGKPNTFFASLISAVPPIVLFSVRLILSMGLILLIVGVAFSAMPEGRREGR